MTFSAGCAITAGVSSASGASAGAGCSMEIQAESTIDVFTPITIPPITIGASVNMCSASIGKSFSSSAITIPPPHAFSFGRSFTIFHQRYALAQAVAPGGPGAGHRHSPHSHHPHHPHSPHRHSPTSPPPPAHRPGNHRPPGRHRPRAADYYEMDDNTTIQPESDEEDERGPELIAITGKSHKMDAHALQPEAVAIPAATLA